MMHDPQNPAVAEAYQNMMAQTMAQYEALIAAGYQFYFFDETNDPYAGNPWNAMRDLRANQRMGVYATEAGFGSGATAGAVDQNVADNPLLADTGLTWMFNGQPKRVLANDLFRAVHDAFGHGLEGAGFRADGEENAWQAHVRLFTGSAIGALTSETRGQNSWLNFGPYGEKNRLASNPALDRSIRHRFPYIDPLHHLQVELIRRYRAGLADERVQRGIHISINGIAAGLRNTG